MHRRSWWGVTVVALLAIGAGASTLREALAQPRVSPSLPSGCSSGQLVVAEGEGRFACRPASRALQLAGCESGDFVVAGASGELRCERPSRTSWGARALLPECSSGASLVSEGFGRWRCVDEVLPRCSSGESLVSEGSGRWRCAESPLPRCSSGEILVSEGGGRWRCASMPSR